MIRGILRNVRRDCRSICLASHKHVRRTKCERRNFVDRWSTRRRDAVETVRGAGIDGKVLQLA
jgi:hypothetical protein